MAEPIEHLLAGTGEPGLDELHATLRDLAGPRARVTATGMIKKRVFRVALSTPGGERRLIVKRLRPDAALRNVLVVEEWLPAVGLDGAGPPLAAVAAERTGHWVWHVYEDLGDAHLVGAGGGDPRVAVAAELIADLHIRFADHHLLPEIRDAGGDLGVSFFESSVRDLASAVERLHRVRPPAEWDRVCERLLTHLDLLLAELPARAEALTVCGGPETLLHGDLWTSNIFVAYGAVPRLIDWDHAGIGPVVYDLSTLVSRFPAPDRPAVLARYREAAARRGLTLPTDAELELAFDTAERGRLANCGLWPAVAVAKGMDEWGWPRLGDVADWLEALEPATA